MISGKRSARLLSRRDCSTRSAANKAARQPSNFGSKAHRRRARDAGTFRADSASCSGTVGRDGHGYPNRPRCACSAGVSGATALAARVVMGVIVTPAGAYCLVSALPG